jgi:hypothetical protein
LLLLHIHTGMHLNISVAAKLMASHPSVPPFLVYIQQINAPKYCHILRTLLLLLHIHAGVHLNISMVAKLMASHPSVLPFLVYIPSESRHVERMAVRAKYMTLDPNKNR